MDVQLKSCGDRELWVASGAASSGDKWTIPIVADPMLGEYKGEVRKYFRVGPAMKTSEAMDASLTARWLPYQIITEKGFTIVTETHLHEFATKAPGITPSYYLHWPPDPPQNKDQVEPDEFDSDYDDPPAATDKFLRYVFQQTQVVPLATLKLVWRAITQCGFTWLAEKHEPIDLGFAALMPVPYRINWHQIMKAMFPQAASAARSGKMDRDRRLENMGFIRQMKNAVLLALDRKSLCIYWRMEVLHGRTWWDAQRGIEQHKLDTAGLTGYARHVGKELYNKREALVDLFTAWAYEAARPCGQVAHSGVHGSEVLRTKIPEGKVTPWCPPEGDIEAVVDGDYAGPYALTSESAVAIEATKRLLKVSNL